MDKKTIEMFIVVFIVGLLACSSLYFLSSKLDEISATEKKKKKHLSVRKSFKKNTNHFPEKLREIVHLDSEFTAAAIQCYTEMGETEQNIKILEKLIRKAAIRGAEVIVTPECALQGYCRPNEWFTWTTDPEDEDGLMIEKYAETIPGPSSDYFAKLAGELKVYICLGLAEKEKGKFYNTQILCDSAGKIVLKHRKSILWTPGDAAWCTPGVAEPATIDSPYGRLGLMICFEHHNMPKILSKANADIVLYSVGWYGPNETNWFKKLIPRKVVKPNKFALILANWSAPNNDAPWPGVGFSAIYNKSGKILASAKSIQGNEIIYAIIKKGSQIDACEHK